MIKVNLLQNRGNSARTVVGATGVGTAPADFGTAGDAASAGIGFQTADGALAANKKVAINLVILLIFPVVLIYYERSELSKWRTRAAVVANEVQAMQNELNQKMQEANQSAGLKEKAKELATKIDILKKLSRLRLREVKALDFIQASLPERVWMKDLSVKSGALMIRGLAVTDDDLTTFLRALEKSSLFSSIVLLQARETRTKDGSVKDFEISGMVEAE